MCKVLVGILVAMCSAIALGQQPQWTVVQHVSLFQQNQPIPLTTIFTPTEQGTYRLTVYLSGGNRMSGGAWEESLAGTDITGAPIGVNLNELCRNMSYQYTPPVVVSLQPNVPLTYQVRNSQPGTCQYNLVITVEQLM